jgi:hypothetical protein
MPLSARIRVSKAFQSLNQAKINTWFPSFWYYGVEVQQSRVPGSVFADRVATSLKGLKICQVLRFKVEVTLWRKEDVATVFPIRHLIWFLNAV